jgi:hypothetical protein
MKDFFKPNKTIIIILFMVIISVGVIFVAPQLIGPGGENCFGGCRSPIIDVVTTKILWLIFIPLGLVLHSIGVGGPDDFLDGLAMLFSVLAYLYLISCILNFIIYKIRTRNEEISYEKQKSDAITSVLIVVLVIIAGIIELVFSRKM